MNEGPTGLRSLIRHLKDARCVATRYDKTAASFLGFVHIVSIRMWISHFVNTA